MREDHDTHTEHDAGRHAAMTGDATDDDRPSAADLAADAAADRRHHPGPSGALTCPECGGLGLPSWAAGDPAAAYVFCHRCGYAEARPWVTGPARDRATAAAARYRRDRGHRSGAVTRPHPALLSETPPF